MRVRVCVCMCMCERERERIKRELLTKVTFLSMSGGYAPPM